MHRFYQHDDDDHDDNEDGCDYDDEMMKMRVFPRIDFGDSPPPLPSKSDKTPCDRKGAITQNNQIRPQSLAKKIQ